MGKRERVREKAIGTAVGVIAVTPVAIAAPPTLATYAIAGVAFLLSFAVYSITPTTASNATHDQS